MNFIIEELVSGGRTIGSDILKNMYNFLLNVKPFNTHVIQRNSNKHFQCHLYYREHHHWEMEMGGPGPD